VDFSGLVHCSSAEPNCIENLVTLVHCSSAEPNCIENLVTLVHCSSAEPTCMENLVTLVHCSSAEPSCMVVGLELLIKLGHIVLFSTPKNLNSTLKPYLSIYAVVPFYRYDSRIQ
jgi:hypothetical protein